MEGLFDNLEGRSDSQNFEPLTSTLRLSLCNHPPYVHNSVEKKFGPEEGNLRALMLYRFVVLMITFFEFIFLG